MSTNCIRCIKKIRTGSDLLCDECRKIENRKYLLDLISGKINLLCLGITSYPNLEDEINKRIHSMCLELEELGKIKRHNESDSSIFWKPVD
jgi:hypothetical protein